MKYFNIFKKTVKQIFLFIAVYFAIYGITWVFFLNIAKKDLQLQKTYTLENLIQLSDLAFEFANNFIIPFVLLFLLINNFKSIKGFVLSLFKKAPQTLEI